MSSTLPTVLADLLAADSTVELLLTEPGRGGIRPGDRCWAKLLAEAAERFAVPLEPIFRTNDEVLLQIEPA